MPAHSLSRLLSTVRACTLCESGLAHSARPVLQAHKKARLLIAGQAPGSKVHASGIPFDDASGNRLREWMGVDKKTFYDKQQVAILPMAFCYPGKGQSGDLPPMPVCAETWRAKLMSALPDIQLTLVIGQYAQLWHLPFAQRNLTETIREWQAYDTNLMPLPHPSPRNNIWLSRNDWFVQDVLPELKRRVTIALD